MVQALLAGVSGISTGQAAINSTAADLANLQTNGYKGTRVTFQEMLPQTLRSSTGPTANGLGGMNPVQYSLGAQIGATQINQSQGSLSATGRTLDLAVQGSGYLMASDGQNISYTRDGSLDVDANGTLVHAATGEKILGWQANNVGVLNTTVPITSNSSIQVLGGSTLVAQATQNVNLAGNLNSNEVATTVVSIPVYVYDGLGNQDALTVELTNRQSPPLGTAPTGANSSWDWTVWMNGGQIGAYNSGSNERLYFDATGNLLNATVLGAVTVPAVNNSTPFNINLNFAETTQLASTNTMSMASQDGLAPGSLQSYSIGNDGTVTGRYSNGINRPIAQISMANFVNNGGLTLIGGNLWQSTNNSGSPLVGTANSGGRGSIASGFLEQSNVDIGSEFSNLILYQRGIQANTQIAKTVNELLGNVIAMVS